VVPDEAYYPPALQSVPDSPTTVRRVPDGGATTENGDAAKQNGDTNGQGASGEDGQKQNGGDAASGTNGSEPKDSDETGIPKLELDGPSQGEGAANPAEGGNTSTGRTGASSGKSA
jgi:hypothetical protein